MPSETSDDDEAKPPDRQRHETLTTNEPSEGPHLEIREINPGFARVPLYVFIRTYNAYEELRASSATTPTELTIAFEELKQVVSDFEADQGTIVDLNVGTPGGVVLVETPDDKFRPATKDRPKRWIRRALLIDIKSDSEGANGLIFRCRNLVDDAISAFSNRGSIKLLRESTLLVSQAATLVLHAEDRFRKSGDEAERQRSLAIAEAEVERAETRVANSIRRRSRFRYLGGTFLGLTVPVLAANILFYSRELNEAFATPPIQIALIFGAIGAIASVYQRLSAETLTIDFTATRTQLFVLGSLKPPIGGVFALVIHFILFEGVLRTATQDLQAAQGLGLFVIVAFFSGFSERFASDMLERTESTLGGATSRSNEAPGTTDV